jgi:hypothetical protein
MNADLLGAVYQEFTLNESHLHSELQGTADRKSSWHNATCSAANLVSEYCSLYPAAGVLYCGTFCPRDGLHCNRFCIENCWLISQIFGKLALFSPIFYAGYRSWLISLT